MHEKELEKRAVRTVRRKKIQDLLAVLFFLLLLPYTCSSLMGAGREEAVEALGSASRENLILWERKNGVWRIPMEDFLVGALAASIPADYGQETLKAQAVILRSSCFARMEEEGGTFFQNEEEMEYLEREERQALWGADYRETEKRFEQAVQDTAGIVLAYEKKPVSPPYFRVSAGKTRSGDEIFSEEGRSFCQSVECAHDLEAEEYLQEKRISRADFTRKLAAEGMVLPGKGAKIVLTRDSAGYVLSVGCNGQLLEGEKFRKLFELPSSCFYLREEKETILLQTKGVGHGLGFNQYSANLLAEGGSDYIALLNSFFTGLSLEKME